jgi:hypothetical protein
MGSDLACELAFLGGQPQHAPRDSTQCEQCAAQHRIASPLRSGCGQALQQPCPRQWPQLAAERLRRRDEKVSKLAKAGTLRVHGSFARGHQRPQRLAFPTNTRRSRTQLCEHAARRADRVERIGLAARATLPPQPADLEHPLATSAENAREAGTERAGALNRERSPTRRVLIDKPEGVRVTAAARGDIRLEHHGCAGDVQHRERMRVAVRVDADDVVQLICKHPY